MNQTFSCIECIIVDDATRDDSIAKCERLIEKYEGPIKFHILHHQQNRGLSAARNTGTYAAIGDYIFYLDGDDEITPSCIERLVEPVKHDVTIEMVKGWAVRRSVDETISPCNRQVRQQEKDYVSLEIVRNYFFSGLFSVAAWNKLIKKNFLDRHQLYFKEGILWEDTLWTFFVMKHLCHLYTIPDITYYYFKRSDSITTATNEEIRAYHWGIVYKEIANHLTIGESGREAKYYVRGLCFHYINNPKIPSFALSAQKFRKELSIWKDPFELVLLSTTKILSRFSLGYRLYYSLVTLYYNYRKRKKSILSYESIIFSS